MRTIIALFLIACGGTKSDDGACSAAWSGALSGSGTCRDQTPAVLGIKSAKSLSWGNDVAAGTFKANVSFAGLRIDTQPGSYTGAAEGVTCQGAVTDSSTTGSFTLDSTMAKGSCVLTLTSVETDDVGASYTRAVHGQAVLSYPHLVTPDTAVQVTFTF